MTKPVLQPSTSYVVLDGQGNYEEFSSHARAYDCANAMEGHRGVFKVLKNGTLTASLGALNLFEFSPFGDMGLFYIQQSHNFTFHVI